MDSFTSRFAEAARGLAPEDRATLKKILEGLSAEIVRRLPSEEEAGASHASPAFPADPGTPRGIPDGPTERHRKLKDNFLKQVPRITR